jgi:hypothetical protein
MAETKKKQDTGKEKSAAQEVMFTCRNCERQRPLSEMRTITRFSPVLIVCVDCQKELR